MDYKKIYDNLMAKARSEKRVKGKGVYYESHHIIPKCMGGEGRERQWETHPNIVLLTAKEHYLAHKLLWFIYPNNHKIFYAFFSISTMKRKGSPKHKISMKEFERLRLEHSKRISGENSRSKKPSVRKKISESLTGLMVGEKNPFFGKKHSDETIKILSDKTVERFKDPNNNPMFGHVMSEESIQKNKDSQPNRNFAFLYDLRENLWLFENVTTNDIDRFFSDKYGKHVFSKGLNFNRDGYCVIYDRFYYCENMKHSLQQIQNNESLKYKSNKKIIGKNKIGETIIFDSLWSAAKFISKIVGKNEPSFYYQNLFKHLDLPDNKKRGWCGYKFNFY